MELSGGVLGLIQQLYEVDDEAAVTRHNSDKQSLHIYLCFGCLQPFVTLTFGGVHVRAADLVHQQHEDEAQDQRHPDAGVKLLVTVLVFAAGAQGGVCLALPLRHFHHAGLAMAVVRTCRQGHRLKSVLLKHT